MKITYTINLTEKEKEQLFNLADAYCTSMPVSGSWETETAHEIKAIAHLFNTNEEVAKAIMIQYLGFDINDLN